MGAYFGYAVASGDIDGDGLDDLIVGAPMYTVPDNPEMTIETGRVYVIYQGVGAEKFRKVDSRYRLVSFLLHARYQPKVPRYFRSVDHNFQFLHAIFLSFIIPLADTLLIRRPIQATLINSSSQRT